MNTRLLLRREADLCSLMTTHRTDAARDRLRRGELSIAAAASGRPVHLQAESLAFRSEVLNHPSEAFKLRSAVLCPHEHRSIVQNECKWCEAGFVVRSRQQREDSHAWSEPTVFLLCSNAECPVLTSDGICDGDRAIVTTYREPGCLSCLHGVPRL